MSERDADPQLLAEFAVETARAAGTLLLERFGGPVSGLDAKSTATDLVSDADRDAEALIVGAIRSARPGDAIVAEEGGDHGGKDGGVSWHVDPLDGTVNYLWGIPHWAVSIHASDRFGDIVGVVFDPCRNELFRATPGSADLNGRPLALGDADDLATALIATGFAYDAAVRRQQAQTLATMLHLVRDVRRYGSAALDLAWLAAGRFDAYYERGLSIWDMAAGSMLVKEAGGLVLPILETPTLPDGIIAGRPGIVSRLHAMVDVGY